MLRHSPLAITIWHLSNSFKLLLLHIFLASNTSILMTKTSLPAYYISPTRRWGNDEEIISVIHLRCQWSYFNPYPCIFDYIALNLFGALLELLCIQPTNFCIFTLAQFTSTDFLIRINIWGIGNSKSISYLEAKSNNPIMACVYMHQALNILTCTNLSDFLK